MKSSLLLGTILFLSFFVTTSIAQPASKLSFETAYTIKFGVGEESRTYVHYAPGFSVNYPKVSSFQSPIHALEMTALYPVGKGLHAGVAAGMAFAWAEKNPLISGEYYHAVMVPVAAKLLYTHHLHSGLSLIPEARIGYQFMNLAFGGTPDGFYYNQKGGITTGLKLKVAKRIGAYLPLLSVGYELNTVHNDVSFGWVSGYNFEDQISYTTRYHLFVVGLGLGL